MRKIKIILIAILALLVIALLGFIIWAETPIGPMPEAIAALESNQYVTVSTSPWYSFTPKNGLPTAGFIFYPGGHVDPRSYAPMMQTIAAHGFQAIIVPMPLNLAVFAPGKASEVIDAYPHITNWSVGGHSLGGAMAANFAVKHTDQIKGLILLAAYPASSDDLSGNNMLTDSIYGTLDGVASLDTIKAAAQRLPPSTTWVEIEGGNHAQFGWYGTQPGDNPASISREDQQNQTLGAILDILFQLDTMQPAPTGEDTTLLDLIGALLPY